jgi:hypothetical protein
MAGNILYGWGKLRAGQGQRQRRASAALRVREVFFTMIRALRYESSTSEVPCVDPMNPERALGIWLRERKDVFETLAVKDRRS